MNDGLLVNSYPKNYMQQKVMASEMAQRAKANHTSVWETDWLASDPVYYNERTGKVGRCINDVIDLENFEIHPEGFSYYLSFGYSVFGQTPIRDVKFLPHSSRLSVTAKGNIQIEHLPDVALEWVGRTSHETDVLGLIEAKVQAWEQATEGEIVVPTTRGFDSRLLNAMLRDKSRIRSFTFGRVHPSEECAEVVTAGRLAQILGTRWEAVSLPSITPFFERWYRLFGCATNAWGMHRLPFYEFVAGRVSPGAPLLSGIIGDAWAGKVKIPPIGTVEETRLLGYTKWVADSSRSILPAGNDLARVYFERNREKLEEPLFRIVEAMRFKLIFLSLLFRVPASYGLRPWSPFLNPDVALSMLTLPEGRRRDRQWQRDFFLRKGLDLEAIQPQVERKITQEIDALRELPKYPLHAGLLKEVVEPAYVEWLNRQLGKKATYWDYLYGQRVGRKARGIWRVAQYARRQDHRKEAFMAYTILKPVEQLLRERSCHRHSA